MNQELVNLAMDALRRKVYAKDIGYIFKPGVDIREIQMVKTLAGSPGMSSWLIQQMHYNVGMQMQVSKNVSYDLLLTEFGNSAKVENVPWVAPVVEVYFEDPLLPTILVMKTTPKDIRKEFPQLIVSLEETEYITCLMQEGTRVIDGKFLSLQLKPGMYDEFLTTGNTVKMELGPFCSDLNPQDNATMSFMLQLALKVFVFASIPIFKPIPITPGQMTRKFGGKPGFKLRPNKPALRVQYLPQVMRAHVQSHGPVAGREFHGRRGHLHWYHNEKFIHRKDSWDYYPPLPDPKTGKYPERSILKVRKP